ncbi:ATP-dependent nuclease [Streptococcus suis]|uniref:ATP-dependent nuclease n=1 Tax=Streptococcus suis TaxID=1307 RepID=UPI000C19FB70|nr:ATP-binding protein [Streptococcus suis]HEM5074962.1 AAA family ATPase [Streptococcus suis]HEM5091165.1 AAA family ATPase [Streptococcus suis]HEM5094627.1 AAA family ATPase [Streptococcus suis]HEM5143034.1 AAA family ATPase [Streptococcus suis]HEM5151498.1 AAA family ATPase [Streptococcus suis]
MLKKIQIQNFKGIKNLDIEINGNFNIIIGENNIGKTTIFESIHLWKMCYDLNVKKDKKGFYTGARNLVFENMEGIRIFHDNDLFYPGTRNVEITLTFRYPNNGNIGGDIDYKLGFSISKVITIDNAYYQVQYLNYEEFKKFAIYVKQDIRHNLTNFLSISESRPISSIKAKEPYMYKAQILSKILKGKTSEVLRNKIRENVEEISQKINSVMGKNFNITENNKEDKNYIDIRVDGKDLLSFGSGFLQLAEIFSSIEYMDSETHLVLIDEPDAHLHALLQKKLIEVLRSISNVQIIMISHNERILDVIEESEILYFRQIGENKVISKLQSGMKVAAVENLSGILSEWEKLKIASKIIFVEGHSDKEFLEKIIRYYCETKHINLPQHPIIELNGIDTIREKLITYRNVLKNINDSSDWLVIRDTDCLPLSKKHEVTEKTLQNMGKDNIEIYYQDGYGLESTFLSDNDIFAKLIIDYYEMPEPENVKQIILEIINNLNTEFSEGVANIRNSEIYGEYKNHFERQTQIRKHYKEMSIELNGVLSEINNQNIQFIMTKPLFNKYLQKLHTLIQDKGLNPNNRVRLSCSGNSPDSNSIFDRYYEFVDQTKNFYPSHNEMFEKIVGVEHT